MRIVIATFLLLVLMPTTRPAGEPGQIRLILRNDKKLCVLKAGVPVVFSFAESITLTQALKEADVVGAAKENKARILRRREDSSHSSIIEVDLQSIRKHRNPDIQLLEHDVVGLVPKKNLPNPTYEAMLNGCLSCGCRIVPGMHSFGIEP